MDDSKLEEDRNANREILSKLKSIFKLQYAGYQEKEYYAEQIAMLGIDPTVARFAILGDIDGIVNTTGANRNCVLLDTIDECVFCADDDTVCNLFVHPDYQEGLELCCQRTPRDAWYYDDDNNPFPDAQPQIYDLLGAHEQLLGQDVGVILSQTA
jgi:hypothetical protein